MKKLALSFALLVSFALSAVGQSWPGNGGKLGPFEGLWLVTNQFTAFSTVTLNYPSLAATDLYNARIGTNWTFGFCASENITVKPFVTEAPPFAPVQLPTHVTRFQPAALTWMASQGLYPFNNPSPNNPWPDGMWITLRNTGLPPLGTRDVIPIVISIPNDPMLIGFRFYVEWLYGDPQPYKYGTPGIGQPSLEALNPPPVIRGSGGGFSEVVIGA